MHKWKPQWAILKLNVLQNSYEIPRYLASSFLGSKGPPNNKIQSKVSRVYAGVRVAKDFEELVRRDVSKDDVAVPSN